MRSVGTVEAMAEDLVDLTAVQQAAAGIADVIRPTPSQRSDTLSRIAGREVWLKPEHLQRTGSFKVRGASHHIRSLPDDGRPVIAASAGNHAQGVALAAALAGRRATVLMPEAAPLPKVEATRAYGAEVRLVGAVVDETLAAAQAEALAHGSHLVPPFDDPLVIAGQGTVGLEVATEAPEVETVLVPIGGGGLLAGCAVALRALRPAVRIVGVEAEGAAAMQASLAAGRPVVLDEVHTIADGIALKSPSALTLAHIEALVDDVVTVTDEEIARTLVLLLERGKAVVEPAGVVGLAAMLAGRVAGTGPALAVLSGGNVDPLLLAKLIEHGLAASGRFARIRVVAPDRPGALARITGAIAALGLNVLTVDHLRAATQVGVDEVEVVLTLETRGPDQRQQVVEHLRADGHLVELLS